MSEIIESGDSDYRYRAVADRDAVSSAMTKLTTNIDYDNFKSHVAQTRGYDYAHELSRVWSVMLDTEDEDARPH
jgi:hypothetical protein